MTVKQQTRPGKRQLIGFRPKDDVERLLNRARKNTGRTLTKIIEDCIRKGLSEYAGKKDQASS